MTPVQARDFFVVVEVILTLNHGRKKRFLVSPFQSTAITLLMRPGPLGMNVSTRSCTAHFPGESLGREVAHGKGTAKAGGFVEVDVVKACEVGAVAETGFALVSIAAFGNR